MLQFWKKAGKKEKVDSKNRLHSSPSKLPKQPQQPPLANGLTGSGLHPSSRLSGLTDEQITASMSGKCVLSQGSELSKTLLQVLADKGALGYFVQYLESQRSLTLIKFWLDVESFRGSISTKQNPAEATVVPVSREDLESSDEALKLSPQHSQRSLGTDCDSLFESPSHSIDSTDNAVENVLYHSVYNESRANVSTKNSDSFLTAEHPLMLASVVSKTNDHESGICVQAETSVIDKKEGEFDIGLSTVNIDSRNNLCSGHPMTGIHKAALYSKSNRDGEVKSNSQSSGLKSNVYKLSISKDSTTENEHINPQGSLLYPSDLSSMSRHSLSVKSGVSSRQQSSNNPLQASLDDAIRIYRKFLSPKSVHRVPIDNEVREKVIVSICREDGIVSRETFTEAQNVIFRIMELDHFNNFVRSDFHSKHQIDVLTSGKVTMADILYNEMALFYFMEFMEQEGHQNLVAFWMAAVNFQQHLASKEGSYDATEAQNDAMILYDKYFSMQATSPLGFGDRVRLDMEQNICREEGPLPNCFQGPITMVQLILEKNFLSSFLSSQLNMKYLTELVNTVQASPAVITRHRKTGSESSSDWSASIPNTLLASEDSYAAQPSKAGGRVKAGEMCIDSRQLNDPDALWRRRCHSGLNFGHINHMGRFVTDVEPEPDRKEESRIAKAVKKLVNMEEDKAKEEMAWQIAEMIVKDITSLTLGNGNLDQS